MREASFLGPLVGKGVSASLLSSDRRQVILPAWATRPRLTQKWILICSDVCMGFASAQESPPHALSPLLTFRSISRTHLSTRWLVQTTGSVFWFSHRARRSWRAWWGWEEGVSWVDEGAQLGHVGPEDPQCQQEPPSAGVRQNLGCGGIHGCSSRIDRPIHGSVFNSGKQRETPRWGWREPGTPAYCPASDPTPEPHEALSSAATNLFSGPLHMLFPLLTAFSLMPPY